MNDIVIDTNVLEHAQNTAESRCVDSNRLINAVLNAATRLCVDEGFSVDPARNRSQIGDEYIRHLHHGTPGFAFVFALGVQNRIMPLPGRADRATKNKIEQLIRKPADRAFLNVAANSSERTLVSHDFQDFQKKKRKTIKKKLKVEVIESNQAIDLF